MKRILIVLAAVAAIGVATTGAPSTAQTTTPTTTKVEFWVGKVKAYEAYGVPIPPRGERVVLPPGALYNVAAQRYAYGSTGTVVRVYLAP